MAITKNYIPDPSYNPEFQTEITARTKLAPGISMAKFLAGYGDKSNLNHIATRQEKLKLAKQYYLHAQAVLTVSQNMSDFEEYRLIVAEGLYKPGPSEVLQKGSINESLQKGLAVVYELRDNRGNNALDKTFDLAVHWKDTLNFNKLILDYDTYDPNGSLNAQIILIMPQIFDPWKVTYDNIIETRFNNYVQATNELIEILLPKEESTAKVY